MRREKEEKNELDSGKKDRKEENKLGSNSESGAEEPIPFS